MQKILIISIFLLNFFALNAQKDSIIDLPTEGGLPLTVKTGVSFIDVTQINEMEGNFTATVDIKMCWTDLRLSFPKKETISGYKDFKNSEAEQMISTIWVPNYDIANLSGEPTANRYGLRMKYDGSIELLRRITGTFDIIFNVEKFPFDKQKLQLEIKSHKDIAERLSFEFSQEELDFSKIPERIDALGWNPILVDISTQRIESWHGEKNSQITVAMHIARLPGSAFGTIFLPLIASLLIPLFAIWLNKYVVEEGEFKVDAFELTSLNIGGLFAVVALNFTVTSTYPALAETDNCVMQLFTLNYLVLAISLAICILFYRFNLVKNWFGDYVQEEVFKYTNWALPLLVFLTGAVIILLSIV